MIFAPSVNVTGTATCAGACAGASPASAGATPPSPCAPSLSAATTDDVAPSGTAASPITPIFLIMKQRNLKNSLIFRQLLQYRLILPEPPL